MISIWTILGIEPTSDISEIKAAYARRAKQFNPEERPDEFRLIFDAYKCACTYARQVKKEHGGIRRDKPEAGPQSGETFDFGSVDCTGGCRYEGAPPEDRADTEDIRENESDAGDDILSRMRKLIADAQKCDCLNEWEKLLDQPAFDLAVLDTDFRREAAEMLEWQVFSAETAGFIRDRFGYGTKLMFVSTYPEKKCIVRISARINTVSDLFGQLFGKREQAGG